MKTDPKHARPMAAIRNGNLLEDLTENETNQIVGGGWSSYVGTLWNYATSVGTTSTTTYSVQHQGATNSIQNVR